MTKKYQLENIQKRLPDNIKIVDETNFDFTDDEFLGILSWLKYFNAHYTIHQKNELPDVIFPVISKRLRLDFGLYRFKNENNNNFEIYLSVNKSENIKTMINAWNL
ncbi:hypothetical protein EDL98_06335 [Ornithobacterium rhinotracheale]|uniref:hypothetical protein n=1 Tax=Ornithobacterium rhinotracheale TaxID=28251 RepID=UPI00129D1764|nr:hypothetical protein [Ornithobacterium rhinotracheale]MRJ10700.1 hypothetical protein [Ornithobacterium rhinotracheale]